MSPEAVLPQKADGLGFQRRGSGTGLDLHIQVDLPSAELQYLYEGGDPRPGEAGAEPTARVQLLDLGKCQVVDLCIFAGAAP